MRHHRSVAGSVTSSASDDLSEINLASLNLNPSTYSLISNKYVDIDISDPNVIIDRFRRSHSFPSCCTGHYQDPASDPTTECSGARQMLSTPAATIHSSNSTSLPIRAVQSTGPRSPAPSTPVHRLAPSTIHPPPIHPPPSYTSQTRNNNPSTPPSYASPATTTSRSATGIARSNNDNRSISSATMVTPSASPSIARSSLSIISISDSDSSGARSPLTQTTPAQPAPPQPVWSDEYIPRSASSERRWYIITRGLKIGVFQGWYVL